MSQSVASEAIELRSEIRREEMEGERYIGSSRGRLATFVLEETKVGVSTEDDTYGRRV